MATSSDLQQPVSWRTEIRYRLTGMQFLCLVCQCISVSTLFYSSTAYSSTFSTFYLINLSNYLQFQTQIKMLRYNLGYNVFSIGTQPA